jgi:Mn-dependent DtxR family transcriptional regulator
MSIDIEQFEDGDADALSGATNAERVVAFLAANDDRAWIQSEIADRTDVKRGSIGPVLSRLHDRGLVRHKGQYWAITDDEERLSGAVALHRATETLNERYGPEDREEWLEHAASVDSDTGAEK